jgi:hypothetical protein
MKRMDTALACFATFAKITWVDKRLNKVRS